MNQTIAICPVTHLTKQAKQNQGEINFTYEITNGGVEDMYLTDVKVDCGCTSPTYSRGAIKPNETTFVTLRYNVANHEGLVSKGANIFGNFPQVIRITFDLAINK